MSCQTCDDLLAAYKCTVKLYSEAMHQTSGLVGDDFRLAVKELERLLMKCQDANNALIAHWREDHNNLSHKAVSL